jgi:ssRNA-specific RNase YbeY (16S rRNA maturation enzyme)
MIHIESDFPFPEELLERAAHAALEHEAKSQDAELSIVLTDNERLQELNLNSGGYNSCSQLLL